MAHGVGWREHPGAIRERSEVAMEFPKLGRLPSGKVSAVIASDKSAVGAEGIHLIVCSPKEEGSPAGEVWEAADLAREDRAELNVLAEEVGERVSSSPSVNNAGYYRIEKNGPRAQNRPGYHIHVIVGKRGCAKFRRCVDSIFPG